MRAGDAQRLQHQVRGQQQAGHLHAVVGPVQLQRVPHLAAGNQSIIVPCAVYRCRTGTPPSMLVMAGSSAAMAPLCGWSLQNNASELGPGHLLQLCDVPRQLHEQRLVHQVCLLQQRAASGQPPRRHQQQPQQAHIKSAQQQQLAPPLRSVVPNAADIICVCS
jgi:hypothetical protein